MNEKWSSLSIEEIEQKLKTSAASGLSPKAARSRCEKMPDPFFTVKRKRIDMMLLDIVRDFFLIMLIMVAILAPIFEGEFVFGIAIVAIYVISLALSLSVYYLERRGMESMSDFFSPTARVIRGGKLYIADYREVIPGDVIFVEKGDLLGCDARIIHSDDLCVTMKIDRKNEKRLQKFANGVVGENGIYAENMSNMLHAGSVVERGSGRAIVVAVGQYTYLGAITGGMTEIASQDVPQGLEILKKRTSFLGLIMLLALFPFCLLSLLFANFGGKALLANVFMVALSFSAACSLSRFSNIFLGFFSRFIKKSALSDNPCIIRSPKSFDDVANLDYLFLLDGSIATDGILHYETMLTADGETRDFERMGQSAVVLKDMIGMYHIARSRGLSSGIKSTEGFDIGISEFVEQSKIDIAALDIRCKLQSFLSSADVKNQDYLVYTDKGEKVDARVAFSKDVIDECDCAVIGGMNKAITDEGRSAIKRSIEHYESLGRRMLIFITCNGAKKCFVGALVLQEGVDANIDMAIKSLRKSGVKIISFSNCIGRNATEIPEALMSQKRVSSGSFIKRELPITYDFGEFEQYCYLDEAMIADLAKHVKSQGKTLGILGFTDYAAEAVAEADVFITCAPVRTGVFGRFSEEIRSLEIPGEQSSSSCTQKVKSNADVLLMRPNGGKGGMEPLWKVVEYCKVAYRNLKNYITYLMLVQLVRMAIVLLPLFFGRATVDARQMILFSLVFDVLVMLVMMGDTRRSNESSSKIKNEFATLGFVEFLKSNFNLCISLAVGCGLAIILSNVFGVLPILAYFDAYTTEFMFMALEGISLLIFVVIYCENLKNKQAYIRLLSSYAFIAYAALLVLLTTLSMLIRHFGMFLGIGGMPLPFFFMSLIPTVAAALCYFVLTEIQDKKSKKGNEEQVKM